MIYTVIDGRSHKWDDLGEAVRALIYCYRRMIRVAVTGR